MGEGFAFCKMDFLDIWLEAKSWDIWKAIRDGNQKKRTL
jgi:hypothetical protein